MLHVIADETTKQSRMPLRDPSSLAREHAFAAGRPVAGQQMVTLTGNFPTRIFEGPYLALIGW